MHQCARSILSATGFVLALAASTASAQETVRIRGTIEKVDGPNLTIKSRDGKDLAVKLSDKARVMAMVKASLADVKPGSYIGVTAMPQPDGSQRAIAIHIFLESQRGVGEGFKPWDLRPNSTMTNAAVDTSVKSVDGQVLTLKYKGGEKKVFVPPETPIVAYAPGDKSEVKAGAHVIIMAAKKNPDGTLEAPSINVGRDGVTPPM
ncbi:MAG TPA: hypothetical protein VG985_02235 [Xanthobacteraceae bacterium]|nr:hypothetical protein [Xanthobacteraceae bacterium]